MPKGLKVDKFPEYNNSKSWPVVENEDWVK